MNNKKTVRLKPEIKEFLAVIGLGKYILAGLAGIFSVSVIICSLFLVEVETLSELLRLSAYTAVFLIGAMLILSTMLDLMVGLMKWFATHKITLVKIEEKNLKIMKVFGSLLGGSFFCRNDCYEIVFKKTVLIVTKVFAFLKEYLCYNCFTIVYIV